ncbi:MAG: dihydroorotase [Xanthomonadales bacterium]|nr:dihydroorotase [Xanthomonadales bacterium]
MKTITLTRPDDWHLHLRDNNVLNSVVADTASRFARAIIMPNLSPPVTTTDQALAYRQRIIKTIPGQLVFKPLMTLYLTDNTAVEEITTAVKSACIYGVKWYPAGATTNAASGVTDIRHCEAVLAAMQEHDLPLLVHAEVTDPEIDVFDREAVFIQRHLQPVIEKFPRLRVIFEHITTQDAVEFVEQASPQVAATITAHHLLLNRNHMFNGGLHPHHYCLPLLKREQHRQALVKAATSGNPKFFLGTDSAPHPRDAKESACGCAGIYTAHAAIELYAEVFEQAGALDKLEAFASFHGPDFYHLPRNQETITLQKQAWKVPAELELGDKTCVPFRAGEMVEWKLPN